jgi:hypothetical protein
MKPFLSRLLLVAGLSLLTGALQAKTLNILLLANASTQDVIQKLIREYQQQNPETDFNVSMAHPIGRSIGTSYFRFAPRCPLHWALSVSPGDGTITCGH